MGETQAASNGLGSMRGIDILPSSLTSTEDSEFALMSSRKRFAVLLTKGSPLRERLEGESSSSSGRTLLDCPTSPRNARVLRSALPHLRPQPLELATSAGFGDRLGMATPGHVAALRAAGSGMSPIFAQQSIREMDRTSRTAQEVMDDATWGVFAAGWRGPHGADADHLKTLADIDTCVAAGYTFFTFDPGEHVDDRAENADASTLRALFEELPWEALEDTPRDLLSRYSGLRFTAEGHEILMDEKGAVRAAVKYGRAVAHAARLYRHLEAAMGNAPFEVEVSVDETELPTTHAQHLYISRELSRLGVRFVSLAPRYIGRFEKGVDYIGSVEEFERDVAVHAAIARGGPAGRPYKLSLHSGSDKFSIYEIAVRQTQGLVHLKTAGTSYLEALRTVAALDAEFFRDIYTFACESYERDRASYHVSARVEKAASPGDVEDESLPSLLDSFDEREILHVTFGSVLQDASLREQLMETLRAHPEEYATRLERHFSRHLKPFAGAKSQRNGGTP